MLSEKAFKNIANEFIGDNDESIFKYKSGNELVQFFNNNFDTEVEYGPGFPSRWFFVSENLKKLYQEERLSEFFAIIMSKEYLVEREDISPIEVKEVIEKIRKEMNDLLYTSPLEIRIHNEKVTLLNKDMELDYIDSGSFAEVYKIKNSDKAKKRLKYEYQVEKDSRHRFKREFEITESLRDIESVINVNNFNPSEGSYVMEWADSNLYDFIIENEDIDIQLKIQIIHNIVRTMSQVHKRNIIHRDLTPQNILRVGSVFKISDFGVGKELNQGYTYNTFLTKDIGQLHYSAPEQLNSLKDAEKPADVYSIGRLINFILNSNPLSYDHEFKSICLRATAKDYKNRYSDADELLKAFDKLIKARNDEKVKEKMEEKIKKSIVNEEVIDYIVNLDLEELEVLIEKVWYSDRAIIKLIQMSPTFAEEMIVKLHKIVYKNTNIRFEIYDKYATVAQYILTSDSMDIGYDELIMASEIMGFVANDVNRFEVQRNIKNILQLSHLDESIKEILRQVHN